MSNAQEKQDSLLSLISGNPGSGDGNKVSDLKAIKDLKRLKQLQAEITEINDDEQICYTLRLTGTNELIAHCGLCDAEYTSFLRHGLYNFNICINMSMHRKKLKLLQQGSMAVFPIWDEVNKLAENIFLLKGTDAFCRACQVKMSLLHKNPLANVKGYLGSKAHKKASKKFSNTDNVLKMFSKPRGASLATSPAKPSQQE